MRKILSRRKHPNTANTIQAELKELKPPRHRSKIPKNIQKMRGLAICQMNMMQILLQKVSRRSKVIRKQEKIVNDNLKRKRIYLEREKFDLMSVLRRGLSGEGLKAPSQSTSGNQHSLAQKSKTRTTGSDLNSRCPSTTGTKSGFDQPQTQSIRGSTAPQAYGDENTSMDGFQSRK